uniref:EB domain-containing protein n=1 Tax=Caenorhabditis japonica TaxID=281687 RepID=A0A8R1DPE4_CAEJA
MLVLFKYFVLFCTLTTVDGTIHRIKPIKNRDPAPRFKRQMYLCGAQPYQYYSTMPCPSSQSCPNGGLFMNVPCTQSYHCTPYYSGVSSCINGFCCTSPNTLNNPPISLTLPTTTTTTVAPIRFGICPSGQLSEVRCTSKSQCASGQTCLGGLCCTTTGNEWNVACGGQTAFGSCDMSGTCPFTSQVCSTSNYCCECSYGQAYGTCGNASLMQMRCNASFYYRESVRPDSLVRKTETVVQSVRTISRHMVTVFQDNAVPD